MSADRVGDLLLRWEELSERGESVTPEELCRDCPELLDELRRRIRALQALNPALDAATLPPVAPGDPYETRTPPPTPEATPTNLAAVGAKMIAGYEILGELGRGGMGVVYKARQVQLNRTVALKMILSGDHADEQDRVRFRSEAEAVARLQHPNIVQIHEVGESDGHPYFSLEFCPGGSLASRLAGTPLPPADAAGLVAAMARAVQAAHEAGIVHRDLKPANILLAADGTPKITDFGLAKKLGEAGRTVTGAILGTPSYMAPEQAAGKGKEVGPAADVYSLGAILYQTLTGAPPFEGQSAWETVHLVLTAEPEPPSRRNPRVARDLETICLRCLDKDQAKRYPSALALADDLRRFQSGQPIQARPVGWPERVVKWGRRHPTLAALLALSSALLLALLAGGWATAIKESRSKQALQAAHQDLQEVNRADRRALIRLNVTNGTHYLEDDDLFGSLIWFARALKLEDDDARRQAHRTRIAAVLRECPRLGQLWFHDGAVTDVTFSPDGRWVLTASDDHTAWVRDAATGQPRFDAPLRHDAPVLRASFSPDGGRVVTAGDDGTARVWDAVTGRRTATLAGHRGPVRDARFSPDGGRVVTAGADATARVWDATSGAPVGAPLLHGVVVVRASFHRDGERVLTASDDHTARLWDAATGQPRGAPLRHDGPVTDASFSPDGRQVATASEDHTARLWDAATGAPTTDPLRHHGAVFQVAFHPDGRWLATASADLTARVWDGKTGQALVPVLRHYSAVSCVAFSPDGARVVTGSDDNTARVWDAANGRPLTPPLPHNGDVCRASFSPDGRRLATAAKDTTARVYELDPGAPPVPPLEHGEPVLQASFDSDGRRVLTASADRTARVWDARTGKELRRCEGHAGAVLSAAFSRDGRRIVTAGADAAARVWDAAGDYRLILTLKGHDGPVRAAAFSPDGARVVTASEDGTARVWDAATGALVAKLGGREEVLDAAFSPDGGRVATAGADGTARLWDLAEGKPVGRAMQHQRRVVRVAFSPDGRRLATASLDRTARLWDAASGHALLPGPLQHAGPVRDVSFSPDGARVLTCSDDNTARVWDAATGASLLPPLRHFGSVEAARFSADGERLATASADNTGRVWDAATGDPLTPGLSHRGWGRVTDVAFSPDGDRLVTAGADGTAQVWRLGRNDWPAEDLERLAELLGGSRIGADAGNLVPLDAGALGRLWDDLRARQPGSVGPSP
jgi:eukaryotic-like serine/threonine-protein kinase